MRTAGLAAAGFSIFGAGICTTRADAGAPKEIFRRKTYDGLRGLAEYPFFEMTDRGLLRLTVDGLQGGIDGHTHFALNSFAGGDPDLLTPHPQTFYYFPPDVNASLYVYANQNCSPSDHEKMGSIMLKTLLPVHSPVTDTHTIPNLLAEMDLLGIDKAVVFPVHCGWPFGDDMTERYMTAVKQSGQEHRFIMCGSVKPTAKSAVAMVEAHYQMGVKGIKMHPNFARFYPDDRNAWPVYDRCGSLGLPVLIHSGRTGFKERSTLGLKLYTEDYSDLKHFEAPIAAFPNVRFVLCHAGALQNELAVSFAKKYKNVWLDIHGQGVGRIQAMIKELGPEKLMYGSDWAFYPEAVILARLLVATENDPVARQMIFSDNARRFWGIA
jgi:predicted TIM-barrel fold metal-dependent hydrolase